MMVAAQACRWVVVAAFSTARWLLLLCLQQFVVFVFCCWLIVFAFLISAVCCCCRWVVVADFATVIWLLLFLLLPLCLEQYVFRCCFTFLLVDCCCCFYLRCLLLLLLSTLGGCCRFCHCWLIVAVFATASLSLLLLLLFRRLIQVKFAVLAVVV